MKKKIIKSFLVSTTLLGLVAVARADDPVLSAPVPLLGTMGLLGQTYAGLAYDHVNLDKSAANTDGFSFQINQALSAGFDGLLTYDWSRSGRMAGARLNQQTLGGALRAFSTSQSWGKPYVEVGAGYAWTKFEGTRDKAFVWDVAAGVEFQAAPAVTVTPYVKYQDARDLAGGPTWNGGVKANYWVNSQWAVTAGLNYDDNHNTGFTVGTNFRF